MVNAPSAPTFTDPTSRSYLRDTLAAIQGATNEMRQLEGDIARARRSLAEQQRFLADRAAEIAGDVADELNGGDKPKYSNADARKAETARRVRTDPLAKGNQRQADELEVTLADLGVTYEHARRTRANLLAVLDFAGRQLSYYSTHREQETRD